MSETQNFKNHTRFHPLFHFFALPILLANIIVSIVTAVRFWPDHSFLLVWNIVLSLGLFMTLGLAREYALKAQDRVIRLEEKLRLKELVSPAEYVEIEASLTMRQYIALRFASNPELPHLARRAVREKLTSKQIKEAIVSWRADNDRI